MDAANNDDAIWLIDGFKPGPAADGVSDTAQGGGYNNGYKPPREIRRMLTPAFVKLFVFDGEFATQLFNPGYRTAFNCLDSICQLNIIDIFEEALEKFYNFERSGDVKKGEQSEEFYVEWLETKKQKLLDEIEFYNGIQVLVMKGITFEADYDKLKIKLLGGF